uniref:Uncharacterized protein n=1 Tax=Salmo trutta TaxID=8032 RepID=A0A673WVJ0_SALTR
EGQEEAQGDEVAVLVILGGAEDECGGLHVATRTQLGARQRVHDGQVAVKAHGGETEDAGVHVEQHHVAADLAEGHTEGPVVAQCSVHCPQWQSQHEGQVSHGQVAYVDVC